MLFATFLLSSSDFLILYFGCLLSYTPNRITITSYNTLFMSIKLLVLLNILLNFILSLLITVTLNILTLFIFNWKWNINMHLCSSENDTRLSSKAYHHFILMENFWNCTMIEIFIDFDLSFSFLPMHYHTRNPFYIYVTWYNDIISNYDLRTFSVGNRLSIKMIDNNLILNYLT